MHRSNAACKKYQLYSTNSRWEKIIEKVKYRIVLFMVYDTYQIDLTDTWTSLLKGSSLFTDLQNQVPGRQAVLLKNTDIVLYHENLKGATP